MEEQSHLCNIIMCFNDETKIIKPIKSRCLVFNFNPNPLFDEEKETRLFTLFVFASMFAFSMQDLILEPFAGSVFDLTPGETTKLSGMQHAGVFVGMIFVSIICSGHFSTKKIGSLNLWITTGCMLSCLALLIIAILALGATSIHLQSVVIFLGVSNGIFSIAAIGLMMQLAKEGGKRKYGNFGKKYERNI